MAGTVRPLERRGAVVVASVISVLLWSVAAWVREELAVSGVCRQVRGTVVVGGMKERMWRVA
ncbi:hypothetical protein [Nocardia wallacei]|uniref:hypothetical protein n=1 Tax=Nocardia wallacei TaxID=480035 RepID=UPI00245878B0|nr:hypothetical protein [Nocardia wallacei]